MIHNDKSIKRKQQESIILKAIADLLHRLKSDIKSLNEVVVVRVDLSPDLSTLKVFLFSEAGKKVTEDVIEELIPYCRSFRFSLGNMISFRRVPRVRFIYDSHYEKVLKIEKLIDSVKE